MVKILFLFFYVDVNDFSSENNTQGMKYIMINGISTHTLVTQKTQDREPTKNSIKLLT